MISYDKIVEIFVRRRNQEAWERGIFFQLQPMSYDEHLLRGLMQEYAKLACEQEERRRQETMNYSINNH